MPSLAIARQLATRLRSLPSIELVVQGAGPLLFIRVLGLCIAYAGNVLIVRWLGPEQAGIFIYCISIVVCIAIASNIGFARASMRFVAQYRACEQLPLLAGVIQTSRAVTFTASIMFSMIGIAVVMATHIDPLWKTPLILSFALAPISSLVVLNTETAIGFGWTTFAYLPDQLLRHVAIIAGIGLYAMLIGAPDAANAMVVVLIGSLAILVYQRIEFRRRTPSGASVTPQRDMRLWVATSLPLWLMALSEILMERIDILLLGYLSSPDDVAVFNAASRTAMLVLLMQYAVIARAAPTVAGLHARGRIGELERFVDDVLFWTLWPTLLIALGLALSGPTALRFFADTFSRGEGTFYILLVSHVIAIYMGPSIILLSMTGHQTAAMLTIASTVALAAILNAVMIPIRGIEGAAIATGASVIIRSIALALLARQLIGIRTFRLIPKLSAAR